LFIQVHLNSKKEYVLLDFSVYIILTKYYTSFSKKIGKNSFKKIKKPDSQLASGFAFIKNKKLS
jgi:hypothetical protein